MIARLLKAGKFKILFWTVLLLVVTTFADWITGSNISMAVLYIVPVMLSAIVLGPWEIAGFSLLCTYLRSFFDAPGTVEDLVLRFIFAWVAYWVSGMFVAVLVRNHQLAVQHVTHIQKEQSLRREAEEQLRALAESSPAAILTVSGDGLVLAANAAANKLFMIPNTETICGRAIGGYLPSLADALRWSHESALRTEAQGQGHRENGELFLANMWFSSYSTSEGKRLAAIVVDSTEELREREEQGLQHLMAGNRIATAAIAHEVRNFSEAMAMLCEDLRQRHSLTDDEGLRGLDTLVGGLETIASLDLNAARQESVQDVSLKKVLDDLRIVIEPDWREIEGAVRWVMPDALPDVWAEPRGLLQAFLNLAQNSHRAVSKSDVRELKITVSQQEQKVVIQFEDSGPGVSKPETLFQPFRNGATGSGLGLYVSRFIVRSFGGELRFDPQPKGSCFIVELTAV